MTNLDEIKQEFLNQAYYDGFNQVEPRFLEDPFYMEKYEEGQRHQNGEWTEQEIDEYYEWMKEQANG